MPSIKREVSDRQPRVKSAKQKARAAANIAAAAARLAEHQRVQEAVLQARRNGMTGTDQQIAQSLAEREERLQNIAFVTRVLQGPHGEKVKGWLKDRMKGHPNHIASVVRNYCRTQGLSVS